jgi:hypothetical protein|tara:strand:- start:1755 stop:1934 length:180 start_codon:yes stop_codon:yes gene_type:complete
MKTANIRIQKICESLNSALSDAAFFQIIISLQEFDNITTDNARIALVDQIIAAVNEARG